MSRRNMIIVASVFMLLVLGFSILPFMGGDTDMAPTYSLGKISRGKLMAEVSATGTLSPVVTVQVGSQFSGTIQHLGTYLPGHPS